MNVVRHAGGVSRLDQLHLHLTEIHEGVAPAAAGCAAAYVLPFEVVHVPGDGLVQVLDPVAGVDDALNFQPLSRGLRVRCTRQLGEVDLDPIGGGGVEVQHLLSHYIREGSAPGELEAFGGQRGHRLIDVCHHVPHVVHGQAIAE